MKSEPAVKSGCDYNTVSTTNAWYAVFYLDRKSLTLAPGRKNMGKKTEAQGSWELV